MLSRVHHTPHSDAVGGSLPDASIRPASTEADIILRLVQIHALTDPSAICSPTGSFPNQHTLSSILARIAKIATHSSTNMQLVQVPPIAQDAYIVPEALTELHPQLLSHLRSGRNNESLPYRGLLLAGEKGCGKTEYAAFLAQLLGDAALVVEASVASIRSSNSPGETIEKLLLQAEEEAVRNNRYTIILFDEGDQLFAPFTAQQMSKKVENRTQANQKSATSTSTHETTSTAVIDAVGQEMLSSLKAALGRRLSKVLVIVTTNRSEIPEELYRHGRLCKVDFSPIGLRTFKTAEFGKIIPQYDDFRRLVPLMLNVMNARHVRMFGTSNQTIIELRTLIEKTFAGLPPFSEYQQIHALENSPHSRGRATQTCIKNKERLATLLEMLEFPIDFQSQHSLWTARNQTSKEIHPFEFYGTDTLADNGWRDYDEEPAENPKGTSRILAYMTQLQKLTPASISAHYQENHALYQNLESAKKALALFLFPQLRHYSLYLAAKQGAAQT